MLETHSLLKNTQNSQQKGIESMRADSTLKKQNNIFSRPTQFSLVPSHHFYHALPLLIQISCQDMKIQKVAVSQYRCNFCLDWHVDRHNSQPPSSINLCEACFKKAKTGSLKVLDPVQLEIYEICLRKTGLPSDESKSVRAREVLELIEFYQRNGHKEITQTLNKYVIESDNLEGELFKINEPFRDFINKIYRQEMNRIETIWAAALKQLNQASKLIQGHRNVIVQNLQTYHYDPRRDQVGLFDPSLCTRRISEIKDEASTITSLSIDKIKQAYNQNPDKFFSSDFNLTENMEPSLELSFLPEESMLLNMIKDQNLEKNYEKKEMVGEENLELHTAKKVQHKRTNAFGSRKEVIEDPSSNKENDCTYMQRETMTDSKPNSINKSSSSQSKQLFPRQTSLLQKKHDERISFLSYYEQFDFTSLKKWPRQKIIQLLNRRNHLPRGYKPDCKKPHIRRIFPQRIMTSQICQALDKTFVGHNMIQLINYPTQDLQFLSYLQMIKWNQRIETIKFVKVGLTDQNLNLLLCFMDKAERVSSLVVSNNMLTEKSLVILGNFARQNTQLKTVYMGRNHISQHRSKTILQELRGLGVNVYV